VVHSFLAEMDVALGAASAVVSRAEASSLAEIAAMRLPALLGAFRLPRPTTSCTTPALLPKPARRGCWAKQATPEQIVGLLLHLVDNTTAGKNSNGARAVAFAESG
jgi:UDP-N-acetylglucosamine:LPS N-acetylglucosamine transferase